MNCQNISKDTLELPQSKLSPSEAPKKERGANEDIANSAYETTATQRMN